MGASRMALTSPKYVLAIFAAFVCLLASSILASSCSRLISSF
jgi:hypothetical protein